MAEPEPTTGWRTEQITDDEVQVYPLADLVNHVTEGDGCVCVPRAECIARDTGRDAWMYVHHALDGRT